MPATTMGANGNFLSDVSTETQRETETKGARQKESMCENEREIHTWLREK